ncbi:prepilin-type N-terminal cleavage/methylation domain-containing protein [Sporosarcina sp. HYO08]|uniref:prepilin-type N-terminal cleavage/methylation domain-containing protein n=1 Tax=Sporosarcina sp. HYO08 TaxID=1759557 RepID=UPI000799F729|nr:prepilin-type N-terminal cleavage/methylation domain-containing protein [Sporosarcina sp. HYO08]KXH86872.1 hypothetical protein AU377_13635 [Sporosarcina sp. HYO08]
MMLKRLCKNDKGLTLVEILAVIVILGILMGIAIPAYLGVTKRAETKVCEANRLEVKKHYEMNLTLGGSGHSDLLFQQFIFENGEMDCPVGGMYGYVDGEVECSEHGDVEDDDGNEVPYL